MLKFSRNYSLSQVTTLGIGGPAKLFVAIKTEEELIEAIKQTIQNGMDYLVIGGGSNLLVSDEGVNQLIIRNEITGITTSKESPSTSLGTSKPTFEVNVKSGTILQELVDYTIQHGLSGIHKMTGIPGTVGGAVYGNAGAYGQTISDTISEIIATDGAKIFKLSQAQCQFSYRGSGFKKTHDTILEIKFELRIDDPQLLAKEAENVLSKRLVKYPPGIKCPGSFFKNIVADGLPQKILRKIPKDKITYGKISAGYLLETVGAQGQKLDGIEIASYHANLFINKGGGTAQAFYTLAKTYAQKVQQKFGITLEPEVQLINLSPIL